MEYAENAVKQDPETGALAQRTMFAEVEKQWRVYLQNGTTHLVASADVESWSDMHVSEGV